MDDRKIEDDCNERRLKIVDEVQEIIDWLRANKDAATHARRQMFDLWSVLEDEYERLGKVMWAAVFKRLDKERGR